MPPTLTDIMRKLQPDGPLEGDTPMSDPRDRALCHGCRETVIMALADSVLVSENELPCLHSRTCTACENERRLIAERRRKEIMAAIDALPLAAPLVEPFTRQQVEDAAELLDTNSGAGIGINTEIRIVEMLRDYAKRLSERP